MIRIPKQGDTVRLTHCQATTDDNDQEIDLPAGTLCEVHHVQVLKGSQGLQFQLSPKIGGTPGDFFIDQYDLVDGMYPFEPVGA